MEQDPESAWVLDSGTEQTGTCEMSQIVNPEIGGLKKFQETLGGVGGQRSLATTKIYCHSKTQVLYGKA